MKHRNSIKMGLEFCGVASAVTAYFLFWALGNRGMTLVQAATGAMIASLCMFAFLFAAVYFGRWQHGDIQVNPWFAWFIAGGSAIFWFGVVVAGHFYGGMLVVGGWGVIVFSLWLLVRFRKRAKAQPFGPANHCPLRGQRWLTSEVRA